MSEFNQLLGVKSRCMIIAEVAQAHDGSLGTAHAYIDAAAESGAHAVKFQTHIASAESSIHEPWRVHFSTQDKTRYDYWQRMEFSSQQWAELKDHADDQGLLFLSSPFSTEAVDLLEEIGIKAWKLASGEIDNPLIVDAVLDTDKPIIMSSGMSSLLEIGQAVKHIKNNGVPFALLQCTTQYPSAPENMGLNLLDLWRDQYGCEVGLSDHSATIYPSIAAATLGATIIEVHLALSRDSFGPDVCASVTPAELAQIVAGTAMISTAINHPVDKDQMARDLSPLRDIFRKSLAVNRDLSKGDVITREVLQAKKPCVGIPAKQLNDVLNRPLRRDVKQGEFLLPKHLA